MRCSPAFWTLLYDRRFPAVCDMLVAHGDGLSALLTFLWADKVRCSFYNFDSQCHRDLEGDFAPRFGLMYSPARSKETARTG